MRRHWMACVTLTAGLILALVGAAMVRDSELVGGLFSSVCGIVAFLVSAAIIAQRGTG